MMFRSALFVVIACSTVAAADPASVLLWPNGAPGAVGRAGDPAVRVTESGERVVSKVHSPSLFVYLPDAAKATGAGVVIAPGGGHREMWTDHEGHNIAKWLAERGVAGFVLLYRLAREEGSPYTIEGHALADTQRAIRLVRSRAKDWRVDPAKVGVMGFSAGGELAALASLRHDGGNPEAGDPVEKLSSKPAFQALIYPAIPRDPALNSLQPPAFLVCGEDDRLNISQGLPELYLKMKQAGMSAELHVYAGAGHGFGLRARNTGPSGQWVARFHEWLGAMGWLGK